MAFMHSRFADKALALLLALLLLCPMFSSQEQSDYLIHVQSDLVLVNVTVRNKSGKFVQGLKPENFTIFEDNKPQKAVSFDVENVDAVPPPEVTQAKPLPAPRGQYDIRSAKNEWQYDTGMSLLSGKYHLKFVVRENQTGRMGSFEADFDVPDLKSQPLKMSSVVLASQTQTAKKGANLNPLIRDGSEIVPNITHVFSAKQHLLLYYEVYNPARPSAADPARTGAAKPVIRLLTNVAFFRGKAKTYESSLVEMTELNARERKAAVFQLDVPLTSLKPGFYTCQVNVIDDAGGHFLFPRLALLIRTEPKS